MSACVSVWMFSSCARRLCCWSERARRVTPSSPSRSAHSAATEARMRAMVSTWPTISPSRERARPRVKTCGVAGGLPPGGHNGRPARPAAQSEGEEEEALAGELPRRDRVEAPVGPAPEAGRAHARLDQAREREPARLAEPAARAAQALRLGREADERQVAVGLVGQPDGAGLEAELLHERLGDLLPALPDRVATREQIEQDLDRGEVDDGVVALLLDLGERLAEVLVPALPRHGAHATSCVSAASSSPSRRRRSTSSHTAGVTPCSRPLSSSAVACASITPVPRSVQATRRSATASSPGTPGRASPAWCERTVSTIAGGRLHASRIQPPTSAWSTPRAAASLRSIASASPALPTLCQYSSRKRMARMSRPTSWSTPAVKASSGSPARSRAASVLAATPTATACAHSCSSRLRPMPAPSVSHTFTPSARLRTVEKPSSTTARGMVATRRLWPKKALFARRSIFPVSA